MPAQPTIMEKSAPATDLPPSARLSPRMKEILELRIRGLTYNQVAQALEISTSTVKVRIAQAKNRLGVRTSAEAMILFSAELTRGNS
jgi:DNA-binding NarL/FixJ family response regulator